MQIGYSYMEKRRQNFERICVIIKEPNPCCGQSKGSQKTENGAYFLHDFTQKLQPLELTFSQSNRHIEKSVSSAQGEILVPNQHNFKVGQTCES